MSSPPSEQPSQSQPTATATSKPTDNNEPSSTSDPIVPVPVKRSPEEVSQQVLYDHQSKLFRPSSTQIRARDIQIPDSFFEPTTSELTSALNTYSKHTDRLQNATMKTKKMREAEEKQRMGRFRNVLIRIQFPDRVVLQGVFEPQSKIRQVVRFVKAALLDARNVKFHFFVVPPKHILSNIDATLWSEGLVPAAVIHIGIDSGSSDSAVLLKPILLSKITDAPETSKEAEQKGLNKGEGNNNVANKTENRQSQQGSGDKKPPRKIPKWFKK